MMLFLHWKQIQNTGRIMDKYGTFLFLVCLSKIHTRPITSLPAQSPQRLPDVFLCAQHPYFCIFNCLSELWGRNELSSVMSPIFFIYFVLPWFSILTCNCVKGVSSCMQLCEGCFFLERYRLEVWNGENCFHSSAVGCQRVITEFGDLQCTAPVPHQKPENKDQNFWLKHEGNNLEHRDAEYRTRMPIN